MAQVPRQPDLLRGGIRRAMLTQLSSFRAKRSGDPEPSGAREREAVGSTVASGSTSGVSPPSRRRWVPGLRLAARPSARNDDSYLRNGLTFFSSSATSSGCMKA